jgi:hypothetical protein
MNTEIERAQAQQHWLRTEYLHALEDRLMQLIQKREACLKVGAVEDASRVGQEIMQMKDRIQEASQPGR